MSRTPIAEREGRWSPGRVLSITAAFGVVAASMSIMQPASAVVPSFPDNVVVFPDRDFISVEGYERYAGELALVQVKRAGTVMGSARVLVSGTDVAFEINHPGGACWGAGTNLNVTPDIQAGDVVSVTFPDGNTEETTTSSATASDMVRVNATTVRVNGTFGTDVNPAQMEQRIIQPDFVDTAIGKRDIRAVPGAATAGPNGGYVSTLTTTPATATVAGTFVATYTFDTSGLADIAMAADLGERAMTWQVEDADGNRQGLTIAEFGEAGGPGMGGCPLGPTQQGAPAGSASAVRVNAGAAMDVRWDPVVAQPGAEAVTGYNVEVIETGGTGPAKVVGQRLGAGATNALITGLDPAKSYTTEVRSMAGPEPKLSVPFAVNAGTQVGDTTPPTLTVTPSGAGTTLTDKVTVTTDGQAFFTLVPSGAPAVPVVDAGGPSDAAKLVTGPIAITQASHLAVVSFDAAGNISPVVEGDFAPPPLGTTPTAPQNLGGTATQNSVSLTWDASLDSSVTGYQVAITSPTGVTQPPVTAVPRQTITGLQPGTSYTFTVAAINKAGTGTASTPLILRTQNATDRITITSAKWKAASDFKVVGTGSLVGATIRLYTVNADGSRGAAIPNATTTVVAAVPPAIGDWTIRLRNGAVPPNPGRIIAVSDGGGTAGPFTVQNG